MNPQETPRPESVQALYAGAKRVAPGVYVTKDGDPLFNAAEVLQYLGLADTPENREAAIVALVDIFKAHNLRVLAIRPEGQAGKAAQS